MTYTFMVYKNALNITFVSLLIATLFLGLPI